MADVVLVNPYFSGRKRKSRLWLFPPLGLGYLAAALRKEGITVSLIDGTFLDLKRLINEIKKETPKIIGITCNIETKGSALAIADELRDCALLVAGGPMPTLEPGSFLEGFDVVVLEEGEESFVELAGKYLSGKPINNVKGTLHKENGRPVSAGKREPIADLDGISFPARDLYDNSRYKEYWQKNFGCKCTQVLTTRGCPFSCNFCSRPVFGKVYRERDPENIVREMEEIIRLGYDRIWFADDVFTLNRERTIKLCRLILEKKIDIGWNCLARIDSCDKEILSWMKKAGCVRVFFGIESGADRMLMLMGKNTTVKDAESAVRNAKDEGLETGGFFMLGYPGETPESLVKTIRFSTALPLDYVSYTIACPLPGTRFYEQAGRKGVLEHGPGISERKLGLAMMLGNARFKLRKKLGKGACSVFALPFEYATDVILMIIW